ncbi:acyltransferase family protein [Ferruginibacter profundus]
MTQRNQSIDALRGFAILAMILSGSISYGDTLPAWMYHAQVPPPAHRFIETIPGITWVDLVFPFFLFSMGAAIPLALNKKVAEEISFLSILWIAARRLLQLAFFALFTEHMKAWVIAGTPTSGEYLLSVAAFVLLFFQLFSNKTEKYKNMFIGFKLAAYLIAIALLFFLKFNGNGFMFTKSDIIIIVLANMAFFGTITWWLTKKQVWVRLGLLPIIMAVFLAAKEPGASWTKDLFNFSQIGKIQFDWLYRFYFLKYLFIVIPGTLAGDWFLQFKRADGKSDGNKNYLMTIGLLAFVVVITNTIFLFSRQLIVNLIVTGILIMTIHFLIKRAGQANFQLCYRFFCAGAYLLILGLFFEAYEGGIKKDHSTYSYYFVTSGLAFFMLIGFSSCSLSKFGSGINNYLSLNGRNPMVAYVAGSLLLTPLLHLTGAISILDSMNANAITGFLKGVIFTGIVSVITIFFTKRGWFWKT